MTTPRLIPCLLLKHGVIVRSQLFKLHQVIGNPLSTVERFSHWNVDELILLDISREDWHDLRRDDLQQRYQGSTSLDVLKEIAKVCFMPLSIGGGIRTLDDISKRLAAGADKCIINTQAIVQADFINNAAHRFGSQCIVVSMDVMKHSEGKYEVYSHHATQPRGLNPVEWAQQLEQRGAGEIFLTAIHRDGSAQGYDLELIQQVTHAVSIPVIVCGGVGQYEDFIPAITQGGASAVAAANIFHFFELSYPNAKRTCIEAGINMRAVKLGSTHFPREPIYNRDREDKRIAIRMEQARTRNYAAAQEGVRERQKTIQWCTHCVYPSISAAPMEFDRYGVCTGCQMARVKTDIAPQEWQRRRELLLNIVEQNRCRDGNRYDCVIAVSGGKDSYYQTHVIRNELGLNPLLVTYNGNNWIEEGWRNLLRMKEAFNVDHLLISPSVDTLKKLNRLAFIIMGDMNWHSHVGIMTAPVAAAVRYDIPLVFYGEHGYLDLCGQFTLDDYPEISYRDRLEHFARGYEWTYFIGREGLTSADLLPWKYPSDEELYTLNLRGLFLGNYIYWEANQHAQFIIDRYGFEISDKPFDRTYRRMSNLDDMHENGVHDYLKYIKFGYGRATDHACKDIRAGLITRDEAIQLVKQYDPVKPSDLKRWLDYTGMSEQEFDAIADTFRDPRVWHQVNGEWRRDEIE